MASNTTLQKIQDAIAQKVEHQVHENDEAFLYNEHLSLYVLFYLLTQVEQVNANLSDIELEVHQLKDRIPARVDEGQQRIAPKIIEQLADKEHASWSRWMEYVFQECGLRNDGACLIPADLVERWQRQAETPYAQLSEKEKQSDRDEVAHIIPIIEKALQGEEYAKQ